jgi:uncharacterized protein (TIGR00255 family)
MIRSMTAFARHENPQDWGQFTWEIRSVNHRYLEPQFKLPDAFRALEPKLRDLLREHLSRGKVECQLRYQLSNNNNASLQVNQNLVNQLVEAVAKVETTLFDADTKPAKTSAIDILRWPGALEEAKMDPAAMNAAALEGFTQALGELNQAREREGDALKNLINQRLDSISEIAQIVKQALPGIIQNQRQKLLDRIKDLKLEVDENRVEQELVMLAQKMDVDEELDRLETHVKEVRRILKKGGACGRKLDFLMQELNREANTLSSKSINTDTTQSAVELKVLIEQMREQIQNIE